MELASILTEQNPQIDLKLHSYEASTRNFLKALSVYKNHAISVIRDRRDNQNAERKRISGKIQSMETDINIFKVKEIDLLAGTILHFVLAAIDCYVDIWHPDLEREQEERKVAELSVASFKRQLASIRDKCASFESEIDQYRAIKDNLRRGQHLVCLKH
jgi:kinetochore protein Spc25